MNSYPPDRPVGSCGGLAVIIRSACLFLFLFLSACGGGGSSGSGNQEPTLGEGNAASWLLRWNSIAIDASGYDHAEGGGGEQLGPTRASRAMAIVHIAIFDAANGINPKYENYMPHAAPASGASMKAAIAQAAHDTLVALYPSQGRTFAAALFTDLAHLERVGEEGLDDGIAFGARVAADILSLRAHDGSQLSTSAAERSYAFSNEPGRWRLDPYNPDQEPLGSLWSRVRPFALQSASQFRAPAPPALDSVEYAEAYAEAYRLGGDGVITPTERTAEQTEIGIFWAYDGTPSLCAPPRLYNQLLRVVAARMGTTDVMELARLFALSNLVLADAAISIWEAKYYYDLWRPVTAIQEASIGYGPTGKGDGNTLTLGDPNFTPLGAPASNLGGDNFTPPFPTYPSGHGGFGGALFQTLRNFYGTDNISFSFISDEYNGITTDADGNVRPVVERSYRSLSEAEEENARSRVYLGIHFDFDAVSAVNQGNKVANYIYYRVFQPLE